MSHFPSWPESFGTADEAFQSPNPNPRQPPRQLPVLQLPEANSNDVMAGTNGLFGEEGALTGSIASRDSNPSSPLTPKSLILPYTPRAYSHSQPDPNKYCLLDCSPHTPLLHPFKGFDAVHGHETPLFSVGHSSPQTPQNLGLTQDLISYIGHEHYQNSKITSVDANQEIALNAGTGDLDTSGANDFDGEPWHRLKYTVLNESYVIHSREPAERTEGFQVQPLSNLAIQTSLQHRGAPSTSSNEMPDRFSGRNQVALNTVFICDLCTKSFTSQKDMTRHLESIHRKHKSYKCPHCHAESNRKDNCRRHIRLQHQSGEEPEIISPPDLSN